MLQAWLHLGVRGQLATMGRGENDLLGEGASVQPRAIFKNFIYFLTVPCGMWDPCSLTRDYTCTPCMARHRLLTTGLPGELQEQFFFFFFPLLLAFIFSGIYSRAIRFCFFHFFWNLFFFCATSSSGLGAKCSFSVRIVSVWQGELMYRLI